MVKLTRSEIDMNNFTINTIQFANPGAALVQQII
jgi:hypothetical protein